MKNIFTTFKIGDKVRFVGMLDECTENRNDKRIYTITDIRDNGYEVQTDINEYHIPYHFYEKV